MTIAFLLVVIVNGKVVTSNEMLFESVYRCNEFSAAIEEGRLSRDNQKYKTNKNVTAYCIPKMVTKDTLLFTNHFNWA